jgi:hypothetical protein
MVDINDYREYKYHIRPNQSIWFCNAKQESRCGYRRLYLDDPRVLEFVRSLHKHHDGRERTSAANRYIKEHPEIPVIHTSRTERQYMGYAIEDRLKSTDYEDIPDGGYTDFFDAMDVDGTPVQIKGKSMPYGSTFDDVHSIEMGSMQRLLKTSDIAGRLFIIDLVLHDANLVFRRLKVKVLSERWNEEVSMKMMWLYDQTKVFEGIGNTHEDDGLWKERCLELNNLLKDIRDEFRKEHGHDLIFRPLLKRDSKTQKRVQVSVSLQGLLDIADDYEIDESAYLVSNDAMVS